MRSPTSFWKPENPQLSCALCIAAWLIPLPRGAVRCEEVFIVERVEPARHCQLPADFGRVCPREGWAAERVLACLHGGSALSPLMLLLLLSWPCCNCCCFCRCVNPSPAALSQAQSTLCTLAGCPWHPYSQGSVRRGMRTPSGIRHGVGTATPPAAWISV